MYRKFSLEKKCLGGHDLTYETLIGLIISMLLGLDREQTYKPDYAESHSVLVDLLKHFSQCMSKDINLIELQSSSSLSKLISNVPAFREHYSDSKTSQFCLQYLHSIEVFLLFLKAERSRNWEMHFQTVREMMPCFDSL